MGLVVKTKKDTQWVRLWIGEKLIGEIIPSDKNTFKSYYLNLDLDESVRIERVYSDEKKNLFRVKKQGES